MSMTQVLCLEPAFHDRQAEAPAGLFDEDSSTRRDLEAWRIATRADLNAGMAKLRLEVQRDLKGVEARLFTWIVGQGAAISGILFAPIRFMKS